MKRVYKFALQWGITTVEVPINSKFVHFAIVNDMPYVWMEVPMTLAFTNNVIKKKFLVYSTGQDIKPEAIHLMTTIDNISENKPGGVWHLYAE